MEFLGIIVSIFLFSLAVSSFYFAYEIDTGGYYRLRIIGYLCFGALSVLSVTVAFFLWIGQGHLLFDSDYRIIMIAFIVNLILCALWALLNKKYIKI